MQSRQIDLTINKMTKAQYNAITPNTDEIYLITDDNGLTQSDITTALGYTPVNPSSLATVATSGDYDDLNNKPTIPTVGNGTITITQGGVTKGTFTTNQSGNSTIALDAGGGGGSYSAGTGIVISNDTISIDTSVVAQLSDIPTNYVTTDTAQNISGRKTFLGEKAIYFKQSISTDKLGFTLFNSSDTELGALEYRPNTVGKTGALLNVNVPYSSSNYVGFRYWGTAVNIIAPKVATAGSYYIPVNITNGNTTVTANSSGTVDISSLISGGGSGGIQNTATGTDSLTILGTATTDDYAVNIGDSSSVGEKGVSVGNNSTSDEYAVALGWGAYSNHSGVAIGGYEDEYVEGSATANSDGVAIGAGASAGTLSVAIGSAASDDNISNSEVGNVLIGARTSAENAVTGSIAIGAYAGIYDENNENAAINNAIQLGGGVNGTSNTFQVWEYPLLSYSTGLIPDARLSSNIARTSQIPTATSDLTNDSGFITNVITALGYTPADNTLSNVSSIDSNSAVKTALDTKLNTADVWYDSTTSTLNIGVAQV